MSDGWLDLTEPGTSDEPKHHCHNCGKLIRRYSGRWKFIQMGLRESRVYFCDDWCLIGGKP